MTDVVVVGSVNYDLGLHVRRLPAPGETVSAGSLTRRPGGKGANQAVAVRGAGATCAIVCVVGSDGAALVEQMREAGIDVSHARRDTTEVTGTAVILVDEAGQNSIVVSAGANGRLTAHDVEAGVSAYPGAVVLTQGESPATAIAATAEAAQAAGSRFVLNLAPAIAVPEAVLHAADPLVVNESEANEVAEWIAVDARGRDAAGLAQQLAQHARSVVITLGAEGAVWAAEDRSGSVAAERVDVVDTTGAGDAFVGAMVAHLTRGASLADAVRVGVEAGTRAVQTRGARSGEAVPS